MIAYVFRHCRMIEGKKVQARLFSGRYRLNQGDKTVTVPLNTPDRATAEKRLRDLIVEKQREQEGIIAPKVVREAAGTPLVILVDEYEADLRSRELKPKHVRDTTTRIRKMIDDNRWSIVSEIRPDAFVKWRASLTCSAKTKKEYHLSASAFLNWLVETERLLVNPLAKVSHVEVRGKQVRLSRAFTEDELQRLFAVAGKRRLAYQMLLYTGQRKSEVRALVWSDLHLDEAQPFALFRADTTKDKDKRAVPLRRELVDALRELKPKGVLPTRQVFWYAWPTYDILRSDFKRAGIERVDGLGRVLHFHSFRKTWQTLGVRYGINQRAAQELLGHSDANLTAKVYTDVPALGLHDEVAKLPWIGTPALVAAKEAAPGEAHTQSTQSPAGSPLETRTQLRTQSSDNSGHPVARPDFLQQVRDLLQSIELQEKRHPVSSSDTGCAFEKMAAQAGIEPATK